MRRRRPRSVVRTPNGTGRSRWRSLGTPAIRSASVERTRSRSREWAGANISTAPTWPAAAVVADASSIMSMALARSMGPNAIGAPSVRFTETLGTVPGGKTDATDTASRSPRWRNTNRQDGAPSYGLTRRGLAVSGRPRPMCRPQNRKSRNCELVRDRAESTRCASFTPPLVDCSLSLAGRAAPLPSPTEGPGACAISFAASCEFWYAIRVPHST